MFAPIEELLSDLTAPSDADDARAKIAELARIERLVESAQIDLLTAVDADGLYCADGHLSAKTMVRHVAQLSAGSATGRARCAAMFRDLPAVSEAFAAGELGIEQARTLAKVHSTGRTGDAMERFEAKYLDWASRLSFREFVARLQDWERLHDQDGPKPSNDRGKTAGVRAEPFADSWELEGTFPSMMGISMREIFDHYVAAELDADWEKARADHGDLATATDLWRTHAERCRDAVWQIFQDAATNPGTSSMVPFVHNIIWTQSTYEEMLRRLAGAEAEPIDVDRYTCRTVDGYRVNPFEAAASSLVDQVRRVIVDAAGVVIDQGRARSFTGSARLAVQLTSTHCIWPGCDRPTSDCEIDHLKEHARGGRTNPGNGAPCCGSHNRIKQKGYRVLRNQDGSFTVSRPDGTEIE